MKKKNKTPKPLSAQAALTRFTVIPVLVLWLLSMGLLTVAVANDMYHQLETGSQYFIQSAGSASGKSDPLPGSEEKRKLEYLGWSYRLLRVGPLLPVVLPQMPDSYSNDNLFWGKWELFYGYQAAVAFQDAEGELQFVSGDYMWFPYAYSLAKELEGYAYIDFGKLEYGAELADRLLGNHPEWNVGGLGSNYYFTGYFEGAEFHPVTIRKITLYDYEFENESVEQIVYQAEENPGRELVTIYCFDSYDGYNYEPGPAFHYGGVRYENAAQLLKEGVPRGWNTLFRSVLFTSGKCDDGGMVTLLLSFSPLGYAALRMLPCYLISALAVVVCLAWLLKKIRQQLTEPLAVINRAYENNRVELSPYANSPLKDIQMLARHFNEAQQERHRALAEVAPLRAALDYAQNAEENRRKMISAIAHELKTPLAIIHSYAEGLQSGIAAQKQEKYLSVILEETERMDAMVLETLDLSRLEAGKVQLSTDQFSLLALTREIFERLAPAAQAKQLQVRFSVEEDFQITADEARISQVVTNFATNAIKYTPVGGEVRVSIYSHLKTAHFTVFNHSAHLSRETLDSVWDSFYRADNARSGDGTGLGLAIAKNIVELHRGSCLARNVPDGVEFGFQLPL